MYASRIIENLILIILANVSFIVHATPLLDKSDLHPTRLIYEFPNRTWVENLAIRANGQILVTILSSPELYLIDPFKGMAVLVHTFPYALSLFPVTEVTPDIFVVSSSNYTISSNFSQSGLVNPNSTIAWCLDLRGVSMARL